MIITRSHPIFSSVVRCRTSLLTNIQIKMVMFCYRFIEIYLSTDRYSFLTSIAARINSPKRNSCTFSNRLFIAIRNILISSPSSHIIRFGTNPFFCHIRRITIGKLRSNLQTFNNLPIHRGTNIEIFIQNRSSRIGQFIQNIIFCIMIIPCIICLKNSINIIQLSLFIISRNCPTHIKSLIKHRICRVVICCFLRAST